MESHKEGKRGVQTSHRVCHDSWYAGIFSRGVSDLLSHVRHQGQLPCHRQQATGKKFNYFGLSFINWSLGWTLLLIALLPCHLHAKENGHGHTVHEEAWRDLHPYGRLIDGCLIRMAEMFTQFHSFVDNWVQGCQEEDYTKKLMKYGLFNLLLWL